MTDDLTTLRELMRLLDRTGPLLVERHLETTVEGLPKRYVITSTERIRVTFDEPAPGPAPETSSVTGPGQGRSAAQHVRLLELPAAEYPRHLASLRETADEGSALRNLLTDPVDSDDSIVADLTRFPALARAVSGFLYIARNGLGLGRIDVRSNDNLWLRPYDPALDYDDYRAGLEVLLGPLRRPASDDNVMQIFQIDQYFRTLVPAAFLDGVGGVVRGPAADSAWWQLTRESLEALRSAAPSGATVGIPEPWQDWLIASKQGHLREVYTQPAPPGATGVGKRIVWPICPWLINGTTPLPARVVTHPPNA